MTWINQKRFLWCLLLLTLAACESEKPTYAYLMQHPEYLQRSYHHCIEQGSSSSATCEMILRAQADFVELINQREQDPEHFGARVLQEQENKAYLRKQFNMAQEVYHQTKASSLKPEDLEKKRVELDKREEAFQAGSLRVNILLTVIAATSNV